MTVRSTWPSGPAGKFEDSADDYAPEPAPPDQAQPDQYPPHAIIGEMAALLRETRTEMLTAGGMLAAITLGIALETGLATRALQPGAIRALNIGLLLGLLFCLFSAAGLLALAGRPTVSALNELRWITGSPVDPRPRWVSLPPVGADPDQWTWIRAHLLVGAARLSRLRIQQADTWTYATAVYFLVWTAVVVIGW
jgi:hypothetical protein